jgi:hypothetical protein
MQRNGQNPIKSAKNFDGSPSVKDVSGNYPQHDSGGLLCPACKTPVPPKPGFRPSSLKCPKCGAAMAKK